jgi:hypothetical protein
MAHRGSHASQELLWTEWFRYISVNPEFQQSNHFSHVNYRTQHEEWNTLGVDPNLTTKIFTRLPRLTNVENYKRWVRMRRRHETEFKAR